jgi:hypothetical protein
MVALIDEARAVREEAQRLRAECVSLKFSCRERQAATRESLASAERAARRNHNRRLEPLPSPWSTLHWMYDDPTLHSVLVAVA